jgi:protease IV
MSDQPDSPRPPMPEGRPPIDPSYSAPPPPPPHGYPPPYYAQAPAKPGGGIISKVATSLIATVFISSIVLNVYFAIIFSQQVSIGPVVEQTYQAGETDQRIAILPIMGVITDETATFVRNALQTLDKSPPAAIVLRVNSGGGTVGASDRIWHQLNTYQANHPDVKIVASFGSYAASGGYYVSAMSDHIYAETTCITGSIGVMGQLFTVEGLLEKVGVQPVTMVATNSPNKDTANDITRTWNDQDREVIQVLLDSAYDRFLQVVVEGRSGVLNEEEVRQLADGHVLTAQQALDAKLVDDIGYLDDAITKAAKLVNLPPDKVHVTVLGAKPTFMQAVMGVDTKLPTLNAEQVRSALTDLGVPRLSYTMTVR